MFYFGSALTPTQASFHHSTHMHPRSVLVSFLPFPFFFFLIVFVLQFHCCRSYYPANRYLLLQWVYFSELRCCCGKPTDCLPYSTMRALSSRKWYRRQQHCLMHTNGKVSMWSIREWIALSGLGNREKARGGIKVLRLPPPVLPLFLSKCEMTQSDGQNPWHVSHSPRT